MGAAGRAYLGKAVARPLWGRKCNLALLALLVSSGSGAAWAAGAPSHPTAAVFEPVQDGIPFDASRRSKWDSPLIADLDQDGRQDVVITEHGRNILIFWNEGNGRFTPPQQLAGGDLHGIAAADYDQDGVMDVIIAQGGGDGANPRRPLHLRIAKDRTIVSRQQFDYFQKGRGRAIKFFDADANGLLDLIVTGFPTEDQPEGANHLYHYVTEERLVFAGNLPQAKWLGYRVAIADLDGDKLDEIIFYGGANMVIARRLADGRYVDATDGMLGALADTESVSGLVTIDYDNDGDLDLFLTRAEHQFDLESYYDPAERRFAFITFRKPFLHEFNDVAGDLSIENLQRTYPHYDIFLGAERTKLSDVADRHAGRDLTISREQARGWPEGPTEAGLYIGYLGKGRWRVGGQVRSRLAAVVHGVTPVGSIEPQPPLPARLFENREGRFVDVTRKMGVDLAQQTTSAAVGDFDNDGWLDIAVLRYGDMARRNAHVLLMNRGGERFESVGGHGIISANVGTTGGAIESFDYDSDGALDLVFSSERGRWQLLRNQIANKGRYAIVRVGSSPSGQALNLGATLTVHACGRTLRRRVGDGSAAFSQSRNNELHVGLGPCASADGAQVRWSNGETQEVALEINGIATAGGN